jgi:hypothetical protein
MSSDVYMTCHRKMPARIQVSLGRLRLYLERLERDVATGDRSQALADCAETSEISRRLWDVMSAEKENAEPKKT